MFLIIYFADATPGTRQRVLGSSFGTSAPENPIQAQLQRLLCLGPEPASTVVVMADHIEHIALVKPWEVTQHLEPQSSACLPSSREIVTHNNGSIDLHQLQAETVELIQRDSSRVSAINTANIARNLSSDQDNFDSEHPMQNETLWQRDFRRSATAHMEIWTATTSEQTKKEDKASNTPRGTGSDTPASPSRQSSSTGPNTSNTSATTAPATIEAKRPQAKKRKSVPEVVVIPDDPPAKKKKITNSTVKGKKK